MGLLKKISRTRNEVYIYEFPSEHNFREVAHWVCRIVNSDIVQTHFIKLEDIERRSDEGNMSLTLNIPIDEEILLRELNSRQINYIEFNGLFKRVPVLVNVNLTKYEIGVGVKKEHLIDMYHIESEFRLN